MGCGASKTFTMRDTAGLDKSSPFYMSQSKCPYSSEWPQEPADMRAWEQSFKDDFKKQWEKDGKPMGVEVNDHKYTTRGVGNTLGFMAGSLSVGELDEQSLAKLPKEVQIGLFAKPGRYPVVMRYSDFNLESQGKLKHLVRFALKVNVPKDISWCEEFNMTFVETVDSFTYANWKHIEQRVNNTEQNGRMLKALFENAFDMYKNYNSGEVLSKSFFSQLPHKLGGTHAMKYRLVPLQDPLGTIEDTVALSRMGLRNYIRMRPAYYALELQVVDNGSKWLKDHPADRWDVDYVRVGCLTIPRQEADDMAISEPLSNALIKTLNLNEEEKVWMHKLFMFHPMLAPEIHMPTGDTQHFRCHFYAIGTELRLTCFANNTGLAKMMPFDQLVSLPELKPLFTAEPKNQVAPMPPAYAKMDRYTRLLCSSVPGAVIKALATPMTDDQLTPSDIKFFGPQKQTTINVGTVTIAINDEDEEFGVLGFAPWLTLRVLRSSCVFPIDDVLIDCDQKEADSISDCLGLTEALPKPTHEWSEMESDAAMERLFLTNAGVILISMVEKDDPNAPPNAVFVADMAFLAGLEVRPGFRRYGTKTYFSGDRKILGIYDVADQKFVKPSDGAMWEHAKFITRQSMSVLVTGGHHLLWTHFLVANNMVNSMVENLPVTHPLRRLIEPFTFRTNYVNNRAKDSLLPEFSMFHHATAFQYAKGVVPMIEAGTKMCDFWLPFSDRIETMAPEMRELPYAHDGALLYTEFVKLVENWLRAHGVSNDAEVAADANIVNFFNGLVQRTAMLKASVQSDKLSFEYLAKIIAQFMFVVTGIHDLVGAVAEYSGIYRTGFRSRPDSTRTDVQSWLIASTLVATTSIRTPPLMSKWGKLFTTHAERSTWDQFLDAMHSLSDRIKAENAKRQWPLNNFDPAYLECAVSV